MKKICYFLYTFLPLLLTFGLEIVASIFYSIVSLICGFFRYGSLLQSAEELLSIQNMTAVFPIFSLLSIAIFGMWYYYRFEGDYLPNFKNTFQPILILGLILIIPLSQFACSFLSTIVTSIHPQWMEEYLSMIETSGLDNDITLISVLYSVIRGPISEELIFRGVTMRAANRVFPFWLACIWQAILFGIYHMNVIQGIYTFILGILLGLVCEYSGSIYYSILLHMLFNGYGYFIDAISGLLDSALVSMLYFRLGILSGILGIVLIVSSIYRRRSNAKRL